MNVDFTNPTKELLDRLDDNLAILTHDINELNDMFARYRDKDSSIPGLYNDIAKAAKKLIDKRSALHARRAAVYRALNATEEDNFLEDYRKVLAN